MEDDGRFRVLVCEDDAHLRSTVERGLRRAGYLVDAVSTGREAVARAQECSPDAAILDIGLPDADGRDVCQALHALGCEAGVVFLTARHHTDDVLAGFAAGGDDYVRKPFEFDELLVRVAAVIRRRGAGATELVAATTDPLQPDRKRLWLDPAAHSLHFGAGEISLTPTEFRILAALIARRPGIVRRAELVAVAWPGTAHVGENTLDQYLTRLRRKLRDLDFTGALETVRGVGYRIP